MTVDSRNAATAALRRGGAATALQTVDWTQWILGDEPVALDDPAETYHEASSLYPGMLDHRTRGLHLLEVSAEMRATSMRAVKRSRQQPAVPLPRPELGRLSFAEVVQRRRSERRFGSRAIDVSALAGLLQAGYGVTHAHDDSRQPLRAVPSGGALYPLELYVAASDVAGLEPALYHFDPLRRVLERIRSTPPESELERLTVYPELLVEAAAVVFMTAMFWRTRFKYGQRGYRFALLEAGHVGQNLLLAAAALRLAAVPVGGFYDRRVNDFLAVDGLHECAVYGVSVGSRRT